MVSSRLLAHAQTHGQVNCVCEHIFSSARFTNFICCLFFLCFSFFLLWIFYLFLFVEKHMLSQSDEDVLCIVSCSF